MCIHLARAAGVGRHRWPPASVRSVNRDQKERANTAGVSNGAKLRPPGHAVAKWPIVFSKIQNKDCRLKKKYSVIL